MPLLSVLSIAKESRLESSTTSADDANTFRLRLSFSKFPSYPAKQIKLHLSFGFYTPCMLHPRDADSSPPTSEIRKNYIASYFQIFSIHLPVVHFLLLPMMVLAHFGVVSTDEVWSYDPIMRRWAQHASMILTHAMFACSILKGKIILAGGFSC